MESLGDVRNAISSFVQDREWGKFHTPKNVALALSGEIGEISEIFQWKGSLKMGLNDSFTSQDREHIGEEVSDVFIYTVRLSDLSGVNLSTVVHDFVTCTNCVFTSDNRCIPGSHWVKDLNFTELYKLERANRTKRHSTDVANTQSPRDVLFHLHTQLGKLSAILHIRSEEDCSIGLKAWNDEELGSFSEALASIILDLTWITDLCDLSLPEVLSDKITKNNKKYPADRCRGKSAKYTSYLTSTSKVSISTALVSSVTLFIIGVGLGYSFRSGKVAYGYR